ncbi:aldo/keto reductase [Chenggangzhangella methanolivorans]|uniref:Aldo/keto reductase n=1 Tax=Chenggangzhangella methanolivorans TaxID=1437009 RepID=A0A9E6UL63_9HYPH|nr:aldo/keto reductase [Chenggangzhangella methanolivorans]QZO00167.1 aldo/keto reductase [Chenggangzhangella methanolivorans]
MPEIDRRAVVAGMAALGAAGLVGAAGAQQAPKPLMKTIPSSGEAIPAVGLGTWITFNVGEDQALRDESAEVMRAFFEAGGRMIDSSPMYGSAQAVVGHGLKKLGSQQALFSAEKVWISSGRDGPGQIEQTRRFWGVPRFDLLQVHNLLAFDSHFETLEAMKAEGKVRYVGVTTSEGRRHGDLEKLLATRKLDFVQLTYNPVDREAEQRLLPLARERGIAVIVNRPFRQGDLTEELEGEKLPDFAGELGATSWAQLILKFVASHPAVTCAIPATTSVSHVRENLAAVSGPMPDEAMRERIAKALTEI